MSDLRVIPSIEQLRQRDAMRTLEVRYGRAALLDALRLETSALRERLGSGTVAAVTVGEAVQTIEQGAEARLRAAMRPSLVGVINATGVILHTNLGRAPLSEASIARIGAVAAGYTNLEYDTAQGVRGRRDAHAAKLLSRLTGAEAAIVVNNNAAATLLTLAALAYGREVIISRGELVEIGGGFRVPDVMAQSGAILREVGTTNRTRIADYAAAIGEKTALILRVHPSNFRIHGFTDRPALTDLVTLGRRLQVPVAEDLGSGWLGWPERDQLPAPLRDEPIVSESVEQGADVVCFSGDKLLGGPQAGIIVGRAAPLESIRRHSLMRAVRVDKLTYAALEATLEEYAIGRADAVPVMRMLRATPGEIDTRTREVAQAAQAAGWSTLIVDGFSTVDEGSSPGSQLPTRLLRLERPGLSASEIEQHLRSLDPPVVARIHDGHVVLDLRTLLPNQDRLLAALLAQDDQTER
jgi:L-seryl-tRNA(Ser) seleniumtransferase